MNGWRLTDQALKHGGIALVALGVGAALFISLGSKDSQLRRQWLAYEAWLTDRCRTLHIQTRGAIIARSQLSLGLSTMLIAFLATDQPLITTPIVGLLFAAVPYGYLSGAASRRRDQIEDQVSSWLQLLANALSVNPALGQAVEATRPLVQPPLSQELDVVTKEIELGETIDQALRALSQRVGSRTFSAALSATLVGHRTGGDLVRMLNESAKTFRELARLEGVVRSKTAENRTQIMVIGAAPFLVSMGMSYFQEDHFGPMLESPMGGIAIGVGMVLWIVGILWARSILMVRI